MSTRPSSFKSLVVLASGAQAAGQFADWDAFLQSHGDAWGFYLDAATAEQQDEWLWRIRASQWWNAWVALAPAAPSSRFECLSDTRQNLDVAAQAAAALAAEQEASPSGAHMDFEDRLLHFLFVRDGAWLTPVSDRHSHYLYRYPLAEALGADELKVTRTLLDLQRRRFLVPGVTLDRTRHCRKCSSAHPHYHDVCPSCRSIQIEKTTALHCFACGHVATQADFQQDDKLVCPQCHAALRHIGVDYDRPMSRFVCLDCHHTFMDAAVQVRCLDCGDVSEPEALDVRTVAPLRLSALGRAMLRQGRLAEQVPALGRGQNMSFRGFQQALAWTLATSTHPALSLCVLDFQAKDVDGRFIPGEQAQERAEEAMRRVHEWLGGTDLSAVDAARRLWVLTTDGSTLAARAETMLAPESGARVVRVDLNAPDAAREAQQVMAQVDRALQA